MTVLNGPKKLAGQTREFLSTFNRDLWILSLGWFVGALGFAASVPFISIYFHEVLNMSMTQIGLFFGVMAIIRSISQAVGGELSDRIGRTPLLVHTQIVRAVTFVTLALAITYGKGFWWIATILGANTVAGAAFMPAVNAMVSDIVPREKRLDGYAVSRAAGNLGWAVGPMIGGFLAAHSYAILFHISAVLTLGSGMIFWLFLKIPRASTTSDRFRFSDLKELTRASSLAWHMVLILCLYLVVAQLVAPFSVYTVDMVGISKAQFGWLFFLNGFMVTVFQIPVTRLLSSLRFTRQLSLGALFYFVGYGSLGIFPSYFFFFVVIFVVTTGELIMSPPSLTLTSRMAPEGRMGRYMGVHGFFTTVGWSLGPLYGGLFLDHFKHQPETAWILIASLALVAAAGYGIFGRRIPSEYDRNE
jgi:MFS family permease